MAFFKTSLWHFIASLLLNLIAVAVARSPIVSDIQPAATTVPATLAAGAPLQDAERLQLTDAVIDRVALDETTAAYAEYFAFPNSTVGDGNLARRAAASACKAFPGDDSWPKDIVWDIFNALLGGVLIPTVPPASPCYDTKWGKKDAARCAHLIENWPDPLFQ
jgi:hypothetical protein